MSQQSIRQAARRAALDGQSKRRRERSGRDKRLDALALAALVAVRERDAAVAQCERRAGVALAEITGTEGLSLREAVQWCGDGMCAKESNPAAPAGRPVTVVGWARVGGICLARAATPLRTAAKWKGCSAAFPRMFRKTGNLTLNVPRLARTSTCCSFI